jgi:hypothetical protein
MPVRGSILAILLCASAGWAAETSITDLKEKVTKVGEVVSIKFDEKGEKGQLVHKDGDNNVTRSMKDVLKIDLRDEQYLDPKTKRSDVELTDGTILHCKSWTIKGKRMELTLVAGKRLRLPITAVSSVVNNAHIETFRKDWTTRVVAKRGKDVMVVRNKDGVPQNIECTLGEADAKGETIQYAISIGEEDTKSGKKKFSELHGLIFKHKLDRKAPATMCRVLDTSTDLVMVSKVRLSDGTLSMKTPSGIEIAMSQDAIVRLDFSKGKLEYLSDTDPIKTVVKSSVEDDGKPVQQHVYKDASLGKETRTPITLAGVVYRKGLAIRPYTELHYNLASSYNEFSAVVGIDDNVGLAGKVVLVIEADGKKALTLEFLPTDKVKSKPVSLNLKNVDTLKIIVKSGDLLDLGKHIDLADAKFSK